MVSTWQPSHTRVPSSQQKIVLSPPRFSLAKLIQTAREDQLRVKDEEYRSLENPQRIPADYTPPPTPKWRISGRRKPNARPQRIPPHSSGADSEGKFRRFGFGSPDPNHSVTATPDFHSIICPLLRYGGITVKTFATLRLLNKQWAAFCDTWTLATFTTPILDLMPDPESTEISMAALANTALLAIRADCDPGNIARILGRELFKTDRVEQYFKYRQLIDLMLSDINLRHYKRAIFVGAPNRLNVEFSLAERQASSTYGNHPGALSNSNDIEKCLAKDHRKRYAFALPGWIEPFMLHTRISPLSVILKEGKKPRVIADLSHRPIYVVIDTNTGLPQRVYGDAINDIIDVDEEYFIGYVNTFRDHLDWIYRLRLTYPYEPIYLSCDDVSGAFKHVDLHPDCVAAHAHLSPEQKLIYNLTLIFGSAASPPNWAIFGDAKCALADFLQSDYGQQYRLDPPSFIMDIALEPYDPPEEPLCQVEPTERHKPVEYSLRPSNEIVREIKPQSIFVDDSIHADTKTYIERVLWASIQALFMLLPETVQRPEVLSREKLVNYSECMVILGLTIDTRRMMVAIPEAKLERIRSSIRDHWTPTHSKFSPIQAAELLGLTRHVSLAISWLPFFTASLQSSLTEAIIAHRKDAGLAARIWSKYVKAHDAHRIRFKQEQLEKEKSKVQHFWRGRKQPWIDFTRELRCDLYTLTSFLTSKSFCTETPIPALIPRASPTKCFGDASGLGMGSICRHLGFYIRMQYPPRVKQCFTRERSINDLETAILVLQIIATLCYISQHGYKHSRWPRVEFFTDNITARKRVLKGTTDSWRARQLLRILAIVMMKAPSFSFGVHHIAGEDNKEADLLSRVFPKSTNDLCCLQAQLSLHSLQLFQPDPTLTSILWSTLCSENLTVQLQEGTLKLIERELYTFGSFAWR